MTDSRKLTDNELEQVAGGGFQDGTMWNCQAYIYSETGGCYPIFDEYSIYSKTKPHSYYECVGYENNNDGSTTWIFQNRGSGPNLLFVARPGNNIITDYYG